MRTEPDVFYPEVRSGANGADDDLPLAARGVQRFVWASRFGAILIEVAGDEVFVNGGKVLPATLPATDDAPSAAAGQGAARRGP